MSHLTERNHKNCLNCNAEVHGKYCHICGQENLEPTESLWHLITHFFNDITHFDGKFFSTMGLLLTRPGFLSAEYKMGRRNSYLNPVRMYIFTSFVFFLLFFTVFKPNEDILELKTDVDSIEQITAFDLEEYNQFVKDVKESNDAEIEQLTKAVYPAANNNRESLLHYTDSMRSKMNDTIPLLQLKRITELSIPEYNKLMAIAYEMDSTEFAHFSKSMYDGIALNINQFKYFVDSMRAEKQGFIVMNNAVYKDKATYDSLKRIGELKESWFEKILRKKESDIKNKYGRLSSVMEYASDKTLHYLPQMLFVSLPLFAFVLLLLYKRNRSFYFVSHGIYSIHLYITYFIVLLLMFFCGKMIGLYDLSLFKWSIRFLLLYMLWYEYKAMRHFYGQGRAKTILKYVLALIARLFILFFLLFVFFGISLINA